MADKMMDAYTQFRTLNPDATPLQLFQAGYTKGAVSMRERAMDQCVVSRDQNEIKNAIGKLPDIG